VNEELERMIVDAFDRLVDSYETNDAPNLRTAAYVVAIDRIINAYDQAGNWP